MEGGGELDRTAPIGCAQLAYSSPPWAWLFHGQAPSPGNRTLDLLTRANNSPLCALLSNWNRQLGVPVALDMACLGRLRSASYAGTLIELPLHWRSRQWLPRLSAASQLEFERFIALLLLI